MLVEELIVDIPSESGCIMACGGEDDEYEVLEGAVSSGRLVSVSDKGVLFTLAPGGERTGVTVFFSKRPDSSYCTALRSGTATIDLGVDRVLTLTGLESDLDGIVIQVSQPTVELTWRAMGHSEIEAIPFWVNGVPYDIGPSDV